MARSRRTGGRAPNGASSIYLGADGRWHGRVTVGVKDDGSPDRRHVKRKTEAEVIAAVRRLEQEREAGDVRKAGRAMSVEAWLRHWLENIARPSVKYKSYRAYQTAVDRHLDPRPRQDIGSTRSDPSTSRSSTPACCRTVPVRVPLTRYIARPEPRSARRCGAATSSAIPSPSRRRPASTRTRSTRSRSPRSGSSSPRRWTAATASGSCWRSRSGRGRARRSASSGRATTRTRAYSGSRGSSSARPGSTDAATRTRAGSATTRPGRVPPTASGTRAPARHPAPTDCTSHARWCPRRRGGGLVEVDVKSRAGRRGIVLPAQLAALLEEHRAAQAREREVAGSVWEDGGWMFAQPNGRPIDQTMDRKEWKRLLTDAGVRPARLHDARHTAATVLLVRRVASDATAGVIRRTA